MSPRTGSSEPSSEPQNLLAAISWTLLVTVMLGGYFLLRMLTSSDGLSDHEEQFFRAGHAHAGVLAAIGILYSSYLGRTRLRPREQVITWCVYLGGTLAMSGGFFVHMVVGEPGQESWGSTLIVIGAVILAVAVLVLAWQLVRARHIRWTNGTHVGD